ncbi:Uncharacterised protein [Chlamydia trachomatis]|nr:Uncharacterised protein [Chlamydia trachomatis]
MNRPTLFHFKLFTVFQVERFTHNIEDVTFSNIPHRNCDRTSRILYHSPTHKPISWLHSDCTHNVVAKMLSHLKRHLQA